MREKEVVILTERDQILYDKGHDDGRTEGVQEERARCAYFACYCGQDLRGTFETCEIHAGTPKLPRIGGGAVEQRPDARGRADAQAEHEQQVREAVLRERERWQCAIENYLDCKDAAAFCAEAAKWIDEPPWIKTPLCIPDHLRARSTQAQPATEGER